MLTYGGNWGTVPRILNLYNRRIKRLVSRLAAQPRSKEPRIYCGEVRVCPTMKRKILSFRYSNSGRPTRRPNHCIDLSWLTFRFRTNYFVHEPFLMDKSNSDTSVSVLEVKGWATEVRLTGGQGIVPFAKASRTDLGPTQPPNQSVPRILLRWIKMPQR